jgi:hypothetical protein
MNMELISRFRTLEKVGIFSPPLSVHISILALQRSHQYIKSTSGEFTKRPDKNKKYKKDKYETIENTNISNCQHPDLETNRIN